MAAEERLDLIKEVFDKAEYIKTINTRFSELGTTTVTEDQQIQPNVEEFFTLYNSLFYDIPALGETNSHDYLVKTSGDYINFDEINEEIAALQAEIAQLRSDLLTAQMENARLTLPGEAMGDEQTNVALQAFQRELEAANENIIQTNTTLSQNTQTSQNTPSATGGSSGTSTGGSSIAGSSGGSSGGGGGTGGGGGYSGGGGGGGGY
tara:strand:- start:700 stop:1320 length:621 start_codon:yes stop_codon:yes gene_type:complete